MLTCWFLCNKNVTPILYVKVKVKVKQSLHRPRGFQDFETPRFRDSLLALRTGSLYPLAIFSVFLSVRR